ncbi:MAG: hypothetical protein ICV66_13690 [Chitinophagaceae bacterium]|nr:hypothetical protein [Chitinophagaceae bacterium]
MQERLKDILSNLSTDIDQETLLLYLQGKLSAEKQHEIEKQLLDNEFHSEALEGLQKFKDQHKLQSLVEQLNKELRQKTKKKKALQRKRQLKPDPWLITAIIIILLLIVISYFIIHRQMQ